MRSERFFKYNLLMILNYDHVLENMSSRPVQHIHGQYIQNKKEYIYYQSLGTDLNLETYISFSDILLGDYFTNKTSAGMINAMNKNSINKKGLGIVKIVGNYMEKMK